MLDRLAPSRPSGEIHYTSEDVLGALARTGPASAAWVFEELEGRKCTGASARKRRRWLYYRLMRLAREGRVSYVIEQREGGRRVYVWCAGG